MQAQFEQPPAEEKKDWYFTFGFGHVDRKTGTNMGGKYVMLHGTSEETRFAMLERFGRDWCMQYGRAEDNLEGNPKGNFRDRGAGVKKFNLELFDHRLQLTAKADDHKDRLIDGHPDLLDYQEEFTETQSVAPDWREVEGRD